MEELKGKMMDVDEGTLKSELEAVNNELEINMAKHSALLTSINTDDISLKEHYKEREKLTQIVESANAEKLSKLVKSGAKEK